MIEPKQRLNFAIATSLQDMCNIFSKAAHIDIDFAQLASQAQYIQGELQINLLVDLLDSVPERECVACFSYQNTFMDVYSAPAGNYICVICN